MAYHSLYIWLVLIISILVDVAILLRMAKRNRGRISSPSDVRIHGKYSPILTTIRAIWNNVRGINLITPPSAIEWKKVKDVNITESNNHYDAWTAVEIFIIMIWGLYFTFPFLNKHPDVIPGGREYASHIQSHHLWTRFRQCGLCAMWNGSIQGGSPAFSDAHGSMLHPLIVITTLFAGVSNGAKLSLIGAFLLAGLAQWWLGWILGLGRVVRVWSALIAIAGGNLAAKLDVGMFGGVISAACLTLVISTIILLSKKRDRRSTVILGVSIALFILSGQGYFQIGFLFISPSILFLFPSDSSQELIFIKRLAQAGLIGLLLSAPLLVPLLHFLPQFGKLTDSDFGSVQPLMYLPLNLVIQDHRFLVNESLSKLPYPAIYGNFIGWVPVILAIFTLGRGRTSMEARIIRYMFVSSILSFWFGSAQPIKWCIKYIPIPLINNRLIGIRFPSLFAGMAIPMIAGLAAIGLDILIHHKYLMPELMKETKSMGIRRYRLDLRWILIIPLFISLRDAFLFSKPYIQTTVQNPYIMQINKALLTTDLQWVNPPYGEHAYMEPGIGMGLKFAIGTHAWFWRGRVLPKPFAEATYGNLPPGVNDFIQVGSIKIFRWPSGREYARVIDTGRSKTTVCEAHGIGGDIDVVCKNQYPGTLIVKENNWTGWYAKSNGNPAPLLPGQWISITIPAGENRVSLRYRPWDVPTGIGLSVVGMFLAIYLWLAKQPMKSRINHTKTNTNTG